MPLRLLTPLLVLGALLAGAAPASAQAPFGALQPIAPGGCIGWQGYRVEPDGCPQTGRAMDFVSHVALSPDGRTLYGASGFATPPRDNGAISIFARDTRTGTVRQLDGPAACIKREGAVDGQEDCTPGRAMAGMRYVIVSADGRFVYGSGWNGIQTFRRDRQTGALTQLPGAAGCLSEDPGDPCRRMRGSRMVEDVLLTPDGRFAYAVSSTHSTVAILRRDRRSGLLTQLPGRAGCVAQAGSKALEQFGCASGRGLKVARGLTLTRDGRSLYIASIDDQLAHFRRDPKTGRLRQPRGGTGCIAERRRPGCARGRGIFGPHRLSLSPDERFAYMAGKRGGKKGSSIAIFRRDRRTGRLTQLPGTRGCIITLEREGCRGGRVVLGAHQSLPSPDGRTLYVAADPANGGIGVWRIDPRSGEIRQLPGRYGCVDAPEISESGCADGPRAGGIHNVVFSPDARFLYGSGETSRAVVGYRIVRR